MIEEQERKEKRNGKMRGKRVREYKELFLRISGALHRAQIGLYSAHAAYFVFFSAIPLLMLLLSALDLFVPNLMEEILSVFRREQTVITPGMVERFLDAGIGMVPASAAVVLWSASRGMRAIGEGISGIYHSEFGKKNLFIRYLYSFLYTIIFVCTVLMTLGLLVFGRYLISFFKKTAPRLIGVLEALFGWRILIAAIILIVLFEFFYKLLGPGGMSFRRHLPGAVFAGGGWVLFSLLFSLYLRYFSNWQSIYGSLSVVMILLFWMYGCMYILMLGALLNTYFLKYPRVFK